MPSSQAFAVVSAARLFALLAVGAPALVVHDTSALLAVLVLALLWAYQAVTATRRELRLTLSPTVEAGVVAAICAIGMHYLSGILAALVVPPLYATAMAGVRLMLRVVAVQLVTVLGIGLAWWQEITAEQGVAIFTWTVAGVGLGLVANVTFSSDRERPDPLQPYRDAQGLIRQLIGLSGDLSSGLDVPTISGEMLGIVGDRIPVRVAAIYVSRGEDLVPLGASTDLVHDDAALCARLAGAAWSGERPVSEADGFALKVGDHAVVAGLANASSQTRWTVSFDDLDQALTPSAVKLDTALLFAYFRDSATADERQRLAREMHDGVAQDIASLGYLIDALAARPADDHQARQIAALRERVTAVVAEVRRSVMNLRTSIGENESLGAAIGAIARHLSESSGIPVQVSLDEHSTRLRPEVEAELFRIAQEAMNNAVKHASASAIEVRCQVYAPYATITVTDDGVGLQSARSDSHGLKIMQERAALIGAHLTIHDNPGGGVTVAVELGKADATPTPADPVTERAS